MSQLRVRVNATCGVAHGSPGDSEPRRIMVVGVFLATTL